MVTLKLGLELESQTLEEGSDIYLECDIKANPQHYKILWQHNVSLLLIAITRSNMTSAILKKRYLFLLNNETGRYQL